MLTEKNSYNQLDVHSQIRYVSSYFVNALLMMALNITMEGWDKEFSCYPACAALNLWAEFDLAKLRVLYTMYWKQSLFK